MTLWNNVTARNVGDTLTIRLAESTEAEKSCDDHRQQVIEGGAHRPHDRRPSGHRQWRAGARRWAWTTDSDFAGNGAATQSNKLDGFITVTVAKRLSNGNLLVRGQKWVAINSGREFVRMQGIVRPERHRAGQQRAVVARGRCLHLLWRAGHGGECLQARLAVPLLQFAARRHSEQDSMHD